MAIVRRHETDYPTAGEVRREVQRLMKDGRHDLAAVMRATKTREQFQAERVVAEEARKTRLAERRKLREKENERRRLLFKEAFDRRKQRP